MSNPDAGYRATDAFEEKKSRGCFLYGCLFSFLFVVLVLLGMGYAGYRFYTGQLDKYTSRTPAEIPEVVYEPEALAELESRVETFQKNVERGDTTEELVLTADDINALIAKDASLRNRVFVRIDDGRVAGDLSVPIDFLPGGKGRFFNASATFDVSFENGVLLVTLADAEVKGKPVPQEFLEGVARQNLAEDLYKDPQKAEMMRRIDRLEIEDDKIILITNPAKPAEQAGSEQVGAEQAGAEETGAEQVDLEQAGSEQAGAEQAGVQETGAEETGAEETDLEQAAEVTQPDA